MNKETATKLLSDVCRWNYDNGTWHEFVELTMVEAKDIVALIEQQEKEKEQWKTDYNFSQAESRAAYKALNKISKQFEQQAKQIHAMKSCGNCGNESCKTYCCGKDFKFWEWGGGSGE